MVKVQHDSDLEREAKKYLPEGMALSVDRFKDAEIIHDDINKWKNNTNRSDLRHFDTKDAREPKVKDIVKRLTGKTSGEQILQSEPDRLVGQGRAGDLLNQYKKGIVNFESFKKAIELAWKKDASLKNLWKEVKGSKDDVFKEMFNTTVVQQWLKDNNYGDIVSSLMKKFNIGQKRAERLYARLPPKKQQSLLNRVIEGKKPRLVKAVAVKKPKIVKITQVSKAGTSYSRVKPQRWTTNELRFILSRRNRPVERVLEEYNSFFPENRTISSLRNKIYRSR